MDFKGRKLEEFRSEWPPESSIKEMLSLWKYDHDVYIRNLVEIRQVLDARQIPCMLAFGTLLGAIRDAGPCEGDQDVDLMVTEEHEDKLVELWLENQFLPEPSFCSMGFKIVRVSNHMVTVMKDNCYVDIYIFRKKPDDVDDGMHWCCWQYRIDDWRVINPWTMNLHGLRWNIPGQPEGYLDRVYGHWRVPANRHASS